MNVRGVTATVASAAGDRFEGAAVLRHRPHPLTHAIVPQLGVPDDALGFRPQSGDVYDVSIAADDNRDVERYIARTLWLERVQSSWWFILEPAGG